MLKGLILLTYGTILLQNVLVEDTSSIQTTSLKNRILEILTPNIISETSEKICIIISREFNIEDCFSNNFPFSIASNVTEFLVDACSNVDLTALEGYANEGNSLVELDKVIIFSCLFSLPEKIPVSNYADFIRIIRIFAKTNIFQSNTSSAARELLFRFLSVVKDDNTTFTLIDPHWIFKAWRPFPSDIIGLVTYPNRSYSELVSRQFLREDENADVTVYLPKDFLDKLVENVSFEGKMRLRILILLIKSVDMSKSFRFGGTEILGLDFGDVCVNNELTMIRIGVRMSVLYVTRKEYSQKDIEPLGCAMATCTFPGMSFVDLRKGIDNRRFCPRTTSKLNSSMITWAPTPSWKYARPSRFCMSERCIIPYKFCVNGRLMSKGDNSDCYEGHRISNITQELYEHVKCCTYDRKYCQIDIDIDRLESYIDVRMFIILLHWKVYGSVIGIPTVYERTMDVLDKGLDFLEEEDGGVNYLYCLMKDLVVIRFNAPISKVWYIQKKNYIYMSFLIRRQSDILGFALYRTEEGDDFSKYHIKYITEKNVSYDYSTNNAIEVVIYLPIQSRNLIVGHESIYYEIFVMRSGNIMKDDVSFCRSRMVMVHQYIYKESKNSSELTVYLKTIEGPTTGNLNMFRSEGYWFSVTTPANQFEIFCVSESIGNICNKAKTLKTYTYKYRSGDDTSAPKISLQNRTMRPLDMLSQLAISMNPRMKQMFQNYFFTFRMVTLAESGLSIIALFCIFISAIILKGWCKKKFNTVQLSISLTLEIAFFLIDIDTITHIGYLIFYYSILAQFAWMLIIGHHQYLKFIKVFKSATVDRKKSLIIGWLSPALIMLIPLLLHTDCLKCDLCYKNDQIFNYFVIGPATFIILTNFLIYIAVMYNILRIRSAETSDEVRKAMLRAAILFPFLLGISWISIFALISPWSWIAIAGSFMFRIVTPSQGFVLFVFVVVLDEDTRIEWRGKYTQLLLKMDRGRRNRKMEEIEIEMKKR